MLASLPHPNLGNLDDIMLELFAKHAALRNLYFFTLIAWLIATAIKHGHLWIIAWGGL